jgi:hypothetical protein
MQTLRLYSRPSAARQALLALLGDAAEAIDGNTYRRADGRVLGVRQAAGDDFAVVELTEAEALQARVDFCLSEAERCEELAGGWPEGHRLNAANKRTAAEWRAKAEAARPVVNASSARKVA